MRECQKKSRYPLRGVLSHARCLLRALMIKTIRYFIPKKNSPNSSPSVGWANTLSCPECHSANHTVAHLSSCLMYSTDRDICEQNSFGLLKSWRVFLSFQTCPYFRSTSLILLSSLLGDLLPLGPGEAFHCLLPNIIFFSSWWFKRPLSLLQDNMAYTLVMNVPTNYFRLKALAPSR